MFACACREVSQASLSPMTGRRNFSAVPGSLGSASASPNRTVARRTGCPRPCTWLEGRCWAPRCTHPWPPCHQPPLCH
eukprot:13158376-Alexandrium_andersonii.AAC.1